MTDPRPAKTPAGRLRLIATLLSIVLLAGCAQTPNQPDNVADPWVSVNRNIYTFNDRVDTYVLKPTADAYRFVTPRFVRNRVTDFFDNVSYPGVVLNDLLQGKFSQSLHDTTRFVINTVWGLGGLFDVASQMDIRSHNEDFGQTLAVWGVGEGPYIVIPVLGPSTTRDVWQYPAGVATNPITYYATGAVSWPLFGLRIINTRANLEQANQLRNEAAVDPYAFTRSAYQQYRTNLIYDGNPPAPDFFEEMDQEDQGGGK